MSRDVIMPALGMAQKTGSIVQWLKQPGDPVKTGDVLMEVETDKAVMEVAADADGFLADVSAAPGREIPVGEVIARIADTPGSPIAPAPRPPAAPVVPERPASSLVAAPPRKEGRLFASPRARRIAAEQGLDLTRLADAGEPQPYLVRHLDALRALAPVEDRHATRPAEAAALRLTATLPADGLADFCAWRNAETGAPAQEIAVIAGMAAAAFRPHATQAPLFLAAQSFGASRGFVDADRFGLGAAPAAEAPSQPSIILRDLRGYPVTDLHLGGESAPVLTLMRRGPELFVTLECTSAHMPPEAAIALIAEFAGRLAEPLRHLL